MPPFAGERALPARLRPVWCIGSALLGVQLVVLLLWSWYLWTHFDLSNDLATFGQAFSQIGSGHLDPYETNFAYHYPHWGYPFYQSAFELIMWPLALLYACTRSLFTLLVVQDLALVGAGLVALRWALELLSVRWPGDRRGATVVAGGLIVFLLVDPWLYWSASYDFHFETLAALFALLAARDGWHHRPRAWLWLGLLLACGDVAATYGIAVGVILLLGGSAVRRRGVAFLAVSIGWLVLIGLVHGAEGSDLQAYGYLAGGPVPDGIRGMAAIIGGALTHPQRGLAMLGNRWHALYGYLAGAGLIGVASVIGLVPVIIVLGTNGLNGSAIWVNHVAAFQNLVIVFFMGVGAVAVITWLVRQRRRGARILACVLGAAGLVQACVISSQVTPDAPHWFATVSAPTAAALARVDAAIPPDAEVIASIGVVGRFAARAEVYPFGIPFRGGETVPVGREPVYFVFVDRANGVGVKPKVTEDAIRDLRARGARTVAWDNEVVALMWTPPPDTHYIRFADT